MVLERIGGGWETFAECADRTARFTDPLAAARTAAVKAPGPRMRGLPVRAFQVCLPVPDVEERISIILRVLVL